MAKKTERVANGKPAMMTDLNVEMLSIYKQLKDGQIGTKQASALSLVLNRISLNTQRIVRVTGDCPLT